MNGIQRTTQVCSRKKPKRPIALVPYVIRGNIYQSTLISGDPADCRLAPDPGTLIATYPTYLRVYCVACVNLYMRTICASQFLWPPWDLSCIYSASRLDVRCTRRKAQSLASLTYSTRRFNTHTYTPKHTHTQPKLCSPCKKEKR